MNKVILVGRLARDPENRVAGNNLEITRFTLACDSEGRGRNGENNAEFIQCTSFNNLASTINRYCTKGTSIAVIGRIHNGSYTAQDGTKRYTTEVVVDSFEFAGTSNRNQSGGNDYQASMPSNNNSQSFDFNTSNTFEAPSAPSNNMGNNDPYSSVTDEISLDSDEFPF